MKEEFISSLFDLKGEQVFNDLAIDIFRYQSQNNIVYHEYLERLGKRIRSVRDIYDIPFLPISFFRNQKVVTGKDQPQEIFRSSGTTGMSSSSHYVTDIEIYRKSFLKCFRKFYGEPSDYYILALLPSYLERDGSSLIYMVSHLINESKKEKSGFYLRNYEELISVIERLKLGKAKILLFGVTFALVELAEKFSPDLSGVTVIETGGMKGMRKEMVRDELHEFLKERFKIESVHSEYGMTELLSQAYSDGKGLFRTPPWMKILMRDPNDPLTNFRDKHGSGGINIIDLANINSCSFIASDDLGRLHRDCFEVLGRFDNSDVRGCNLLV